ncbi:bifunctional FO biosynthesis protein CofGH [Nocardioides mangrovicus]|nr:bifunctional FO biosynthesis protein CofGH [Nocardioides mangrovicus]
MELTGERDSGLRRALRRARDGVALNTDEAVALLRARGAALEELLDHASRVRDAGLREAGRPGVITYSPKVFIPLTRLCRDRCHYCTFATTPHRVPAAFLERDEVLAIARAGAELGCTEALFTLGDRPEDRWSAAATWLDERGYDSTLDYVRACAIAVLEETGLLPHLNPGVMSWEELNRLKPVAASMGMMLETTSTRLFAEKGEAHFGSPDKDPAVRLRVLEDAGRLSVPFTTGLLVGIGETPKERVETILAIRASARTHHHVQEVIVQNFRAKSDTAMRDVPDAEIDDLAATVAVTRLLLGPTARVQAPPNLLGEPDGHTDAYRLLIRAGIDDWGGVSPLTPDHVNPERPWPALDELASRTADAGFELRPRLTVYPGYQQAPWLDPRLSGHVGALADAAGLKDLDAMPVARAWQEPDDVVASSGRVDLHVEVDTVGRSGDRRDDFDSVYGDWDQLRSEASRLSGAAPLVASSSVAAALSRAEADPAGLSDDEYLALMTAEGEELRQVARLADGLRRDAVGDAVSYVVNRNINFTNICYTGCRFCAFAQRKGDADAYSLSIPDVVERAVEAWDDGATEVCMQGGIDPDLPASFYPDLLRALKARLPDLHVHAFSPMEIVNGASRRGVSIADWLIELRDAGLDTIPGTAAEILDDEIRWVLTKGKLPASTWIDVVRTAHRLGIRSSSTMMYGHVDSPLHWVRHLRVLRDLHDDTGGFTEFVPLPFVHTNAPLYLAGAARPGPATRDNVAVHAVARIMLHGRIENVQTSWVKLGPDGTRLMLTSGANDLGGTLMEETISRMAGSTYGSAKTVEEMHDIVAALPGRFPQERSTVYGRV